MQKSADISKIKSALVLNGIFSETTYVCAQGWERGGGIILTPLPTSKRTPKKPTQIRVNKKLKETTTANYFHSCHVGDHRAVLMTGAIPTLTYL